MTKTNGQQRQINILLIGETQSGKSTLAEALKRYENPKYKVQSKLIGNGTDSMTTEVQEFTIRSNLPYYGITKLKKQSKPTKFEEIILQPPYSGSDSDDSIQPVYHDTFKQLSDQEYEQQLDNRKDYRMFQLGTRDHSSAFTIIDTPGLNDTRNEDEDHIVKIFSKLQGSRAINLVLVLVPPVVFTNGFKSALKGYITMFPELDNVLAFVHTKFNYNTLHPADVKSSQTFAERKRILNDIMGRDTFPHFVIDSDLVTTKPVRICITHNTINDILKLALKNIPIAIPPSRMINKTPHMRKVDEIIIDRSKSVTSTVENTLKYMDKDEGELLTSIYNHEIGIVNLEADIQYMKNMVKSYETDELELFFEDRFDDSNRIIQETYEIPREMKKQDYQIRRIVIWGSGFRSMDSSRWEGEYRWKSTFKKLSSNRIGYVHVKIYATRRDRHRIEIKDLKKKIPELEIELEKLRKEKDDNFQRFKDQRAKIQRLIKEHVQMIQVIRLASAPSLSYKDFFRLLKNKNYTGPLEKCSVNVEKTYRSIVEGQEYNNSNDFSNGNLNNQITSHQNIQSSDLISLPLESTQRQMNFNNQPPATYQTGGEAETLYYGHHVNEPLLGNQHRQRSGIEPLNQYQNPHRGYSNNSDIRVLSGNKGIRSDTNANSYGKQRQDLHSSSASFGYDLGNNLIVAEYPNSRHK